MFSDYNGMKLDINFRTLKISEIIEIKQHTLNCQYLKTKSQGQLENTLR